MSDLFLLNPKNEVADDADAGFVPMALVSDGFSGQHTFEKRKWKEIKRGFSHFQDGDIGVAKISPCFENLKSTIFTNLPNQIGAGTTELVILRSLGVNSLFYLNLLKSDWYISEGTKYFKGVVGQQRVHKDIFTVLKVPVPPIEEQTRIIEEVAKWFSVIDYIDSDKESMVTLISKTKSMILDFAISGKLVSQNPDDEPAIELLKRINPDYKPCDTSHYQQLPAGWVTCSFKDVFDDISSKPYQILQSEIKTTGKYPVISQSSNFIEGYTDTERAITNQSCIIFGDHTRNVKFIDFDFVVGADGVKIITTSLNPKFAFYSIFWASQRIENKGYSRHYGQLKQQMFNIPPLKEQSRIVDALETYNAVLDDIAAEL